jgi:hypothetical protein
VAELEPFIARLHPLTRISPLPSLTYWTPRSRLAFRAGCFQSVRSDGTAEPKGILPVLWKLFPDHPNLLEAHFDGPYGLQSWVRKPLLGREGANITISDCGEVIETGGCYGGEGFVYQQLASTRPFEGWRPNRQLGDWPR